MYICIYVYIYICICIYIERERERFTKEQKTYQILSCLVLIAQCFNFVLLVKQFIAASVCTEVHFKL